MKTLNLLFTAFLILIIASDSNAQLHKQSIDLALTTSSRMKLSYTRDIGKHFATVVHVSGFAKKLKTAAPTVEVLTTAQERAEGSFNRKNFQQKVFHIRLGNDFRAQTPTFAKGARLFAGVRTNISYYDVEKYEQTRYRLDYYGLEYTDYDTVDKSEQNLDLEVGLHCGFQYIFKDRIAFEFNMGGTRALFTPDSKPDYYVGDGLYHIAYPDHWPEFEFKLGYRF